MHMILQLLYEMGLIDTYQNINPLMEYTYIYVLVSTQTGVTGHNKCIPHMWVSINDYVCVSVIFLITCRQSIRYVLVVYACVFFSL